MVDAIILAGGLGTRLAPRLPEVPKTMAPIGGTPFLHILFEQLSRSKIVSNIILALGHRAAEINAPAKAILSIEPEPLGTGGALLYALPKTTTKTLLVLNGDSFFDLTFDAFLSFHQKKRSQLTIASRKERTTSRYGLLQMGEFNRIVSFEEKKIQRDGLVSAGIYLIERELLTTPPRVCSLESDLFPEMVKKRAFAFSHTGAFIDIGTPDSYEAAQTLLKPWIL